MLTDNEIIKALESCNALVKMRTCKTCPLYTFEGCCTAEMLRQTVGLIARQKEQIEALIAGQETLQKALAEKTAEVERLKEYPKCVYEYDGDITDYCLKSPCSNYKTADEIKSEAVKAFADLVVKNICEKVTPIPQQKYLINMCIQEIENIKKEMVGEEQ